MSIFGRKQSHPSTSDKQSSQQSRSQQNPNAINNNTPPSRQAEHAAELPRVIDSNFCWNDEQES